MLNIDESSGRLIISSDKPKKTKSEILKELKILKNKMFELEQSLKGSD